MKLEFTGHGVQVREFYTKKNFSKMSKIEANNVTLLIIILL